MALCPPQGPLHTLDTRLCSGDCWCFGEGTQDDVMLVVSDGVEAMLCVSPCSTCPSKTVENGQSRQNIDFNLMMS